MTLGKNCPLPTVALPTVTGCIVRIEPQSRGAIGADEMLLKDVEVGERLGMARSTTWDCVREGTLPPPIRRGSKWSRWPSAEIDHIEAAIAAGASDEELRALVRELIEARAAGRAA